METMGTRAGTGLTVLVIDDDVDLLPNLVETIRALSDFAVVTATDGATGLERFYETRPACVVVDVRMPLLDGYQFVRALRGDPATAATPLIMLTAMAQDKDMFAGLAAGVDTYLVKPVKSLDLIQAIRDAIQVSADERQRRLCELAEAAQAVRDEPPVE